MNSKIVMWVGAAILVIGVGWIIYSGSSAPAETGPIKVGVISPFTGDAAVYGEAERPTLELAFEEINAAGGIGGRKIEAIYEDGKCLGVASASAAQKLINVDKVQVIIGGFCSAETIPIVPIAEAQKVLVVSPSASSPDLTGISPYFFRVYPSDVTQGKVLAETAYNSEKWRTVAVIQEQTEYTAGIYKSFEENFSVLGGTVVNESFPTSASDVRSILTKLKSANPDALFLDTQTPESAGRVLKQLKDMGWRPKLMVSDTVIGDPATIATHLALLEGAIGAEFVPNASDPKFKQLSESYRAKYNKDLAFTPYMAPAYDIAYLVRDGISAVGNNGEKLAQWSRTINDWKGASGSITIGSNGDRVSGHQPEVIRDGKVVPYQQ